MKDLILNARVEISVGVVLNLHSASLSIVDYHRKDRELSLLSLFKEDIEFMYDGGLKNFSDKKDFKIKDLKKCAALLNKLIEDIENLPDEGEIK